LIDIKTLFKKSDGEVVMTIGSTGEPVSGVEKLAQYVTNILLTDTGSNIIHPNVGGNIKKITTLGGSAGSDISQKKAEITTGVMNTERFIINTQLGLNISNDEKLLSLKIVLLEYNKDTREWKIDILIETVAGTVYIASIN
jgi:hypothetical protein